MQSLARPHASAVASAVGPVTIFADSRNITKRRVSSLRAREQISGPKNNKRSRSQWSGPEPTIELELGVQCHLAAAKPTVCGIETASQSLDEIVTREPSARAKQFGAPREMMSGGSHRADTDFVSRLITKHFGGWAPKVLKCQS